MKKETLELESFESRLLTELTDLDIKIKSLASFLNDKEKVESISQEQYELLKEQYQCMDKYFTILCLRFSLLCSDKRPVDIKDLKNE